MLIPFGILSAAGIGSDYELIESYILGTSVSEITFSNLANYASVYEHLQIRGTIRTTNAQAFGSLSLRLNGDTGSNYIVHELFAATTTSSSRTSGTTTSMLDIAQGTGANNDSNAFGGFVIDLLDVYSTSKNKTARSLTGRSVTTNPRISLFSGLWVNTASVTSLTLLPNGGNILTGSRLTLYGIK
jgi:hypothetical protein